jgi:uncharacterized protein (TIGR02270 family)
MAAAAPSGFLGDVLAEHAELAGLMIRMREPLLDATDVDLAGLARFDDRLDAHLDGLRAAGAEGYAAAVEALRADKVGSLFVVTVLAVEQRNDEHASQLAAVSEATPAGQRELAAALAWVPPRRIERWAEAFAARGPADRAAALLAHHVHRLRPPADLVRWMAADASARRRALAYQALADAEGEVDAATIEPGTRDPCPDVRLAALWAAARKAQAPPSTQAFLSIAAESDDLAERSFDLAARCAPASAEHILSLAPSGAAGERASIRAVVAAGVPSMVPWLWPRLRAPVTARLAGWAYATVTGCDLRAEGLVCRGPAPAGVGPNDDPADPRTAIPPEHRAPWPDADLVQAHGERWRAAARGGERYLLGRAMTRERLAEVRALGTQPRRAHAALALALLDRGAPVLSTRAPGFRQAAACRR